MYFSKPIVYLEDSDFDENGKLINPSIPKDKPVIIMIYSSQCGHCIAAHPAFQQFADKYSGGESGKVFVAAIQADGKYPEETALSKRLKVIDPAFRGFPDYVKYLGGKMIDNNPPGRSVQELASWI